MKGLLMKDFTLLFKACKSVLIMIAVFLIVSLFSDSYGFLSYYAMILAAMVPITLLAYDEKEKWDMYFQTLPVSKSDYVSAKYLTGILTEAAVFALLIITRIFKSDGTREIIMYAALLIALGMLFLAVDLPVIFKFGSVKGRIVNIVLVVVVCILSTFTVTEFDYTDILTMLSEHSIPVAAAAVIVSVVLCLLSWSISVTVYKKREI